MNINPEYFYRLALAGYFGLFSLLMLWPTILLPPVNFPVALCLLVTVTPLLLPLQGLLNKKPKSCAWSAYISLLYFLHGSIEVYANADGRFYALLETALSLMLFFGANFYVRQLSHTA